MALLRQEGNGLTGWKREVRGNTKMRASFWMLTRIG